MTFTNTTNISYTEMAKWVDANLLNTDYDENTMCKYIYLLVVIKTQQGELFKDPEQVDDFALYCTSRLLKRIQNKSCQNIKSISNYIRIVLSPWKAEYIREFCTGSPDVPVADFDLNDFSDYLVDEASVRDYKAYRFSCVNTTDVIRKYMKQLPRKKKSAEWSNIYVSCLLTLQNRMRQAALLVKKQDLKSDVSKIDYLIRQLKKSPPILYHIDESLSNYVLTIVNELTHAIAVEVSHTTMSTVSVSACMRNLVIAATNQEDE